MTLKRWIVGLLAVVALGGCGVGVDDPEGQAAAGKTGQGLTKNLYAVPVTTQTSAETGSTTNTAMGNDGTTYLPQDPVPLFILHPNGPDPSGSNGGLPH